jgi:hypothetical protein
VKNFKFESFENNCAKTKNLFQQDIREYPELLSLLTGSKDDFDIDVPILDISEQHLPTGPPSKK